MIHKYNKKIAQRLLIFIAMLFTIGLLAACGASPEPMVEAPPRRGSTDVLAEVQEITAEILEVSESDVAEGADFRTDLGADDSKMAELASEFEKAFSVDLSDEEVSELTTISSAVDLIDSKK